MAATRRICGPRGVSLLEVFIGTAILACGILGTMSAFSTGYLDAIASGGLSKATAYAREGLENFRNRPFIPGPLTATDALEGGEFTRTSTIAPVPGTAAPNRLVRIVVTVNWEGRGSVPRAVTLETMRAE